MMMLRGCLTVGPGCDLILVNADGRVVESGTHGELMALKGEPWLHAVARW